MKYELVLTGKLKKIKLAKKRGLNIKLLDNVVEKLLHVAFVWGRYHTTGNNRLLE